MTTVEGIIFGIIHGLSQFLPLGASGHDILVPAIFHFQEPTGAALGALALGALLAILIYFIHDWASMFSSFLQIVIFRKYPMMLDERLPLFVLEATIPVAVAAYYAHERLAELVSTPVRAGISLAAFGVLLLVSESLGRKTKGVYDWNWLDALWVGLAQVLILIPGCGVSTAALCAALLRNYRREAAAKFALFCTAPVLLGTAVLYLREIEFHAGSPAPGLSWVTLVVTVIVTCLTGLLAIGGLMKHIERKGLRAYVVYRIVIGLGLAGWLQWKG